MLVNRWRLTTVDPLRTVHALAVVRCSDVFAEKFTAPVRSSAARAAHRELRSLLRFRASNACDRRARPPCWYDAISSDAPRRSRANPTGIIGPKQA